MRKTETHTRARVRSFRVTTGVVCLFRVLENMTKTLRRLRRPNVSIMKSVEMQGQLEMRYGHYTIRELCRLCTATVV